MELKKAYKPVLLSMGLLFLMLEPVFAVSVSQKDLEKVEKQVEAQTMEHKKLQAQATKISMELASVNQDMIKSAKMIQNSEAKISQMENELLQLQENLEKAEEEFIIEDENLIKTLSALQI